MNLDFIKYFPHVNASLNALASVLLVVAVIFIKRKNIPAHRGTMLAAFATSCLFLVFYVTHYIWRASVAGGAHTKYYGPMKPAYYIMLLTHIVLAIAVPVMAVLLIRWGLRRDDARHRKLAKIAFPVWLYVSITGVLIYAMLYHWNPGPPAGP